MTNDLKNLSDDALVAIYRSSQSRDALGVLFNRYAHLVYGVCMKYFRDPDTAQEHVSQVFEKLITELPKHQIEFFRAWLYRVAQNQCLMTLRSNKHKYKSTEEFLDDTVEYENGLHPKLEKEQELNKLEAAIQTLNHEQRICIELFYLQKKCYTDIVKETGFTFMQVKSHIQNGKRNLKIKLTS